MQSTKTRIRRDFSAKLDTAQRSKRWKKGKRGVKRVGKERNDVAAVVDCRALTLAGHKAISKFHLF